MDSSKEVISAFIDGESFDATELSVALADADGRALLIDLLALRRLAQVDASVPAAVPRARGVLRLILAAAAILLALAGGYRWGANATPPGGSAPTPTRVITDTGPWQAEPNGGRQ